MAGIINQLGRMLSRGPEAEDQALKILRYPGVYLIGGGLSIGLPADPA